MDKIALYPDYQRKQNLKLPTKLDMKKKITTNLHHGNIKSHKKLLQTSTCLKIKENLKETDNITYQDFKTEDTRNLHRVTTSNEIEAVNKKFFFLL